MSDHDEAAIDMVEQLLRGIEPRQKSNRLKAALRMVGIALAAIDGNDEAGAVHTHLGREHFTRGTRR